MKITNKKLLLCMAMTTIVSAAGCSGMNLQSEKDDVNETSVSALRDISDIDTASFEEATEVIASTEEHMAEDNEKKPLEQTMEAAAGEEEAEAVSTGDDSENEQTTTIPTTLETMGETTTKKTETTTEEATIAERTTEAVVLTGIDATVIDKVRYIGDTLSASDFNVTVTYSNGTESVNPAGWTASSLNITGEKTMVTISYGKFSTVVEVDAVEKPVETTAALAQTKQDVTTAAAVQPTVTSVNGIDIVNNCSKWIGVTPYVWGGSNFATGTDCSGFIVAAYNAFGIQLPHYSGDLTDSSRFQYVSQEQLLPGDVCGETGAVEMFCGWVYKNYTVKKMVESEDGEWVRYSFKYCNYTQEIWDEYYKLHPDGTDDTDNKILSLYYEVLDTENVGGQIYIRLDELASYTLEEGETLIRYDLTEEIESRKYAVMMGFPCEDGTAYAWLGNPSGGYRMCNNTAQTAEYTGDRSIVAGLE